MIQQRTHTMNANKSHIDDIKAIVTRMLMPKIGNELKHHFVHIISFPMTPYSPVSHLPMLGKVIG